jgi:hypothetical protein
MRLLRNHRVTSALGGALAGFAMSIGSVASAAPPVDHSLYTCKLISKENLVPQPPPVWELMGEPPPANLADDPQKLTTSPCPPGEIAYPKPLHGKKGHPPLFGTAPEGQEGGPYWYVGNYWWHTSVGGSVNIAVEQPYVKPPQNAGGAGAHSLAQLAFSDGKTDSVTHNTHFTIELGWNVDRGLYNTDSHVHLFTYVNKDGYASNATGNDCGGDCYNGHFVPSTPQNYMPGQVLSPTGSHSTVRFAVLYVSGNWWYSFNNQWMGYTPASGVNNFWAPGSFSSSPYHEYYGEVYDGSNPPTVDMGNCIIGSNGNATQMDSPYYYSTNGAQPVAETLSGTRVNHVTNPSWYDGGINTAATATWKFGGPGADGC